MVIERRILSPPFREHYEGELEFVRGCLRQICPLHFLESMLLKKDFFR